MRATPSEFSLLLLLSKSTKPCIARLESVIGIIARWNTDASEVQRNRFSPSAIRGSGTPRTPPPPPSLDESLSLCPCSTLSGCVHLLGPPDRDSTLALGSFVVSLRGPQRGFLYGYLVLWPLTGYCNLRLGKSMGNARAASVLDSRCVQLHNGISILTLIS